VKKALTKKKSGLKQSLRDLPSLNAFRKRKTFRKKANRQKPEL